MLDDPVDSLRPETVDDIRPIAPLLCRRRTRRSLRVVGELAMLGIDVSKSAFDTYRLKGTGPEDALLAGASESAVLDMLEH